MKTPFQLFDSLLEPCFILNKDLKVVYANETAATVCGQTVRRMQRLTFPELMSFSEPLEWMGGIEAVTDATPYKEVHFKTSEGGEGKVQITCQEINGGQDERHWVVFVRDVTLEERLQNKYRGELEQKEGYILELQKAQGELEKYSKNLEKMVEERTAEIRQLNRLMSALLDSLNQGFFVFDREGLCLDFSSKACENVLEGRPNKRPVWDVLGLQASQVEGFKKWLLTLFAEMLPFEDLAVLGPAAFPHSEGKHIKLEYFPLKGEGGMEGIVVVASDITSLVEAQREAESERENARLILNLINKKQQITRFVRETRIILNGLQKFLLKDQGEWDTEEIFRALHTIKGGCASYNVLATTKAAHEAENRLSAYNDSPTPENAESLRRQTSFMSSTFETFLKETREIFGASAFSDERMIEVPVTDLQKTCSVLSASPAGELMARGLREKFLFEPVKAHFEPYNDVIQKVAENEGKRVHPLVMKNAELRVLPEAYSNLFATFVHAFRNAVDHGIETPARRRELGKSPLGTLTMGFEQEGGMLRLRLRDDGGGIDPARIRARLKDRGVPCDAETDQQVIQHVFDSSFSTRTEISETSGRGVGMDAIKIAAEDLGGRCHVISEVNTGTELIVEVPWITDIPETAKRDAA
ncbi:MAG: PAS domain S-box protein [Bdellovibrionaceae bacterium]|nr:PAS domain S-box protein [Pseudobdellovibrionaceae bacterium]